MSGSCKSCGAPMVSSDICERCDHADEKPMSSDRPNVGRQPVGTYAEYRP